MEGPATVSEHRQQTRRVPGTIYFPSDPGQSEEPPFTELQSVIIAQLLAALNHSRDTSSLVFHSSRVCFVAGMDPIFGCTCNIPIVT